MHPFHTCLRRLLTLIALACMVTLPQVAHADASDIRAAARGVVRVVVVDDTGDGVEPVSHGSGFAVTPELVVTNAHVVADVRQDNGLAVGLVPSEGGRAIYGRIVGYAPDVDLALIRTTEPLNLAPLAIAGNVNADSGEVTAVGYPMNVDRAQGLSATDLFRPVPPVTSTGFLSGRRPSRDFDTLLHTAPIARGNSGGPLLDNCGRVVGVNSFGADSTGADAEFYFAISTRELLPFLRAAQVTPQVNGLPCRSIAELEADERDRFEREQLNARVEREAQAQEQRQARDRARSDAEHAILAEREDGLMLTIVLMVVTLGGIVVSWQAKKAGNRNLAIGAGILSGLAAAAGLYAWFGRPDFEEIDERVAAALAEEEPPASDEPTGAILPAGSGPMICVIQVDRSRITASDGNDIEFEWNADGCADKHSQYGLTDGKWSRVMVPATEAVVSVNSYDPEKREYMVERYLLNHEAMEAARDARTEYEPPQCGSGETGARELGSMQAKLLSMLPDRPNERLVYKCNLKPGQ